MKIGLINNLYKPYQKGGAERVVELLAFELRELNHTVFIISTRPALKNDKEEPGTYYLESSYSALSSFSYSKRLLWQINNLINFKKFKQVLNILQTEKPDLVITHNLMGLGLLTPLAINKSGANHIQVLHDIQLLHPSGLMYFGKEQIINSKFAKIYQKLTSLLFSLGTSKFTVVSPSKWLLDLHITHGLFKNNKQAVITNPFPEIETYQVNSKNSKTFIFIGQLEYHKGLDLFIQVADKFKNYNFLVVGDGSLKNAITETDNLKLLGKKTSKEVSKLLSESLAVIIPSRCYENSPTVIYEAAAVGTPVIAANLGGIPELVKRFGGILFEPDNLISLTEAITEFLEEERIEVTLPAPENYAKKILAEL